MTGRTRLRWGGATPCETFSTCVSQQLEGLGVGDAVAHRRPEQRVVAARASHLHAAAAVVAVAAVVAPVSVAASGGAVCSTLLLLLVLLVLLVLLLR